MLNEVWQLAQSLNTIEAKITPKNPRVKEDPSMKVSPALRVRLGPTGEVTAVEEISEDEWVGVWTIREGNATSFPIVRPTNPLIPIGQDDSFWDDVDLDAIDAKWKTYKHQMDARHSDWKRLVAKAEELRQSTESSKAPNTEVKQFAEHFILAAGDPATLLSKTANLALKAWREGRFSSYGPKAVAGLMAGTWERTKNGQWKQRANVQLLFDIAVQTPTSSTIYCEQVRRHVVEVLPAQKNNAATSRKTKGNSAEIACSLSGERGAALTGKFPKVTLPVFRQEFALFARFKAADCHRRYGMIESASMQVGQLSAGRLQEALSYIVAPEKKNYTWRGVASGKFEGKPPREKYDQLIVYPDTKPDLEVRVVQLFGTDDDTLERQFDADTKAVCESLKGVVKGNPASKLQLFLIRKLDKARAMVVMSESPTVSEVIDAASRWSEAATNVPEVMIPLPPKEKKQPPIEARPHTPYPDQVVPLLCEQWVQQGKRVTKLPGIGLGDVLHLMLRMPGKWEAAHDHMLDLFVSRLSPLLIGIGGQLLRYRLDKKPWEGYPAKSRQAALRAVSVAGILLHAHNRPREIYMTSSAFSIGQFLKLADTLHKDYCIVVRNGSLPPSLIGNAMMPTAVDNPRRAIADLNDRMRVYTCWAKTVRDPREAKGNDSTLIAVREARKTLRCFEPLAATLRDAGLPERCDNTMKAEMLLGYLAKVQDPTNTDKEPDRE